MAFLFLLRKLYIHEWPSRIGAPVGFGPTTIRTHNPTLYHLSYTHSTGGEWILWRTAFHGFGPSRKNGDDVFYRRPLSDGVAGHEGPADLARTAHLHPASRT